MSKFRGNILLPALGLKSKIFEKPAQFAAPFLLDLLFDPEEEGDVFLRKFRLSELQGIATKKKLVFIKTFCIVVI
jgi:hypothetical protein